MRLFIIRIKSLFIPFFMCLFIMFLILYSSNNIIAAKNGIKLWSHFVIPSMFPFLIATNLLINTNIISYLGKILEKFIRPAFNVPGQSFFPIIMGIVSGYPVGAKIVSDFKKNGICNKEEAERLIAYTNNSGPLFIIGTVGIGMFCSQKIGFLLFFSHILSCILVGFLFRFWKNNKKSIKNNKFIYSSKCEINFYNLGEILSTSIKNSIESILLIGGFIVFFSVIISMLDSSRILNVFSNVLNIILNILNIPTSFSNGIIIGLVELTNGLKIICIPNNNTSIIICSFMLGLGGISIFMQILSIISKEKISILPYIIGKFLQACFSTIFMWFFLY